MTRPICCLCGGEVGVGWCPVCLHYFCAECRPNVFKRGRAAVKQWLLRRPPEFCNHDKGKEL